MMRKRKLKQKLSLTVKAEIRLKAQRLARKHHRSISSLFEHLIEVEYRRMKGQYGDKDTGIYRLGRVHNGHASR